MTQLNPALGTKGTMYFVHVLNCKILFTCLKPYVQVQHIVIYTRGGE
jgi:hypothetical protein